MATLVVETCYRTPCNRNDITVLLCIGS